MEEDGFVFSGEQLALVFQFQLEESATVKEYKYNLHWLLSYYLYSVFNIKQKKALIRQTDTFDV